jgi:hypothetical protein
MPGKQRGAVTIRIASSPTLPNVRFPIERDPSRSGADRVIKKRDCDRKHRGLAMTEALQINFALWGMIICAVIKLSQFAV